jgi:hypothetical protein
MAAAATTCAAQMQAPTPPFPTENPIKFNPREVLRANQEDIEKGVARLTQLVSELQKGLEESDTKNVLSINVIHTTEEIEKLAKKIRSLIRA